MNTLTFEQLQQQHQRALTLSEQAVRKRPEAYRQVKSLIHQIVNEPVDVGEYFHLARTLTDLLNHLGSCQPGSIFEYYQPNIDPLKQGQARYFRMECCDLLEQLQNFEQWRKARRPLKLIRPLQRPTGFREQAPNFR